MKLRLRLILITALLVCCLSGLVYWGFFVSPYANPEAALAAFYGGEPRPECMQADPLQRDGRRVVPLVIRDLPSKTMVRRRYAIGFLGEGRYAEALPALERILVDPTEKDYFRGDALLAIYEISPSRARQLVTELGGTVGFLDMVVKVIERGDLHVKKLINRSCG